MVLVADEEDVAPVFLAMQDMQPIAGIAGQDFQGGMDAGIAR